MVSRRSARLFLLAVLVLSACDQSVILEIMELRSDERGEKHPSWRSSSGASPGTVVRISGHPLVQKSREVTVSIGKQPCPVMKRDDHAVIFMVPPMAPGTSTVTIATPGSKVSRPIVVQPIPRLDGTPGDVTRRFLDEVESLLAQSGQHLEHPAIRPVIGRMERLAMTAAAGGEVQQIVFLIDVSGSMREPDLGRPRLDLAKETIADLLRKTVHAAETVSTSQGTALQYRVGVTPFAERGLTKEYGVAPTADLDKVAQVVKDLSIHPGISIRGTSREPFIRKGLEGAAEQLGGDGGIIMLLSDGVVGRNPGSPVDPRMILGNIAEQGNIVIHTIGIGAPGHEEFNDLLLRKLSEQTGGDYYHTSSQDELRQAYYAGLVHAFSQNIIANTLANTLADTDQALLKENIKRVLAERRTLEQGLDAVRQARAILETMGVDQLRNLDGIVHASHAIDAIKTLRIDESTPVPDRGNALAPCVGTSEKVVDILRHGWQEAAWDVIEPNYYEILGLTLDLQLSFPNPVFATVGGYVGTVSTIVRLAQSIRQGYELVTKCIEAIDVKP